MSAVTVEALRPLQREKRASNLALTGEITLSNVGYQMMIDRAFIRSQILSNYNYLLRFIYF
jgi:hypothetical protein